MTKCKRWVLLGVLLVSLAPPVLVGCIPDKWVGVSPDGQSLVLSIGEGGEEGVYWLTLDGKHVKRLADHGFYPKFSPDGRYCSFAGPILNSEGEQEMALVLYDLAAERQTVLRSWEEEEESLIWATWKPDGTEIAYVLLRMAEPQGTLLHVIDVQTKNERRVGDDVGLHCAWSPDGERLAYYQAEAKGFIDSEHAVLGSLQVLEGGHSRAVAGVLFDPGADVAWLTNDRILFVSPRMSLPASEREKNDVRQAVCVGDLVTRTVAPIYETIGISWHSFSSGLRLSPDRRRFLFGTLLPRVEEQPQGEERVTLWCYSLSTSKKEVLVPSISSVEAYPFWVDDSQVGYFEDENTIAIAQIDEESKVVSTRTLDLEKLLTPLQPEAEPAPEPEAESAEGQ